MKLIYAKDPIWANRSKTLINLVVRFEEINAEMPFTASPKDVETHGREIFARAVSEEFGEVADFNADAPSLEDVAEAVRQERDRLLALTDWTQAADVPQNTKDIWVDYRQVLRDMPQQIGFPWRDQLVVETDFGFAIDLKKAPFPDKP